MDVDRRPLRVLFVVHGIPSAGLGGTEIFAFRLARHLVSRGFSIRFFCPPSGKKTTTYQGIRIHFARNRSPQTSLTDVSDPAVEEEFGSVLRQFKPDLVHIHHFRGLGAGIMRICRRHGVPYVVSLHDFWSFCFHVHLHPGAGTKVCMDSDGGRNCSTCFLHVNFRGLTSRAEDIRSSARFVSLRRKFVHDGLQSAGFLIAPSRFVRKRFLTEWNDLRKKIVVVPNGADHRPITRTSRIHRRPVFAFFGGLAEVKGLYVLLNAWAHLPHPPELRLYGARPADILKWLLWNGYFPRLRGSVRLCGTYEQSRLPRILSEVDAVVVPSFVETFSLTALEALHAGKPVIAARSGALGELITHGVNGILFKSGDSKELASIMRRWMENRRGFHFETDISRTYSMDRVVSNMTNIYDRVVHRGKSHTITISNSSGIYLRKGFRRLARLRSTARMMRSADLLRAAKEVDRAAGLYRRILRRDPQHIIARYRLVDIYLKKNDLAVAESSCREIFRNIARLPQKISSEAYEACAAFDLARICAKRGNGGDSLRWVRHCLKIIPYHPRARMLLEELQGIKKRF